MTLKKWRDEVRKKAETVRRKTETGPHSEQEATAPDGCSHMPENEPELWKRLYKRAYNQVDPELAGTLKGFRIYGARLWTKEDGGLTIRPLPVNKYGYPWGGKQKNETFSEDVQTYITDRGFAEDLSRLLATLEMEYPTDWHSVDGLNI